MSLIDLILVGTVVFLVAGAVKGLVGIGLPTASISMLTLFIDPRMAIALVLGPMVFSNAWQVWQMGEIARALRDFRIFAVALAVGVFVTVMLSAEVSDRVIYLALGISIVSFSVLNLRFDIPPMPVRFDRAAQLGFGTVAGVLGGLSGVWAAPMIIYLTARQVPKDEFVRATGLLIFLGSLPLVAGYVQQGFLTADLAMVSAVLVVPTLLGFALGARLRSGLSNEKFRKVLLYVFLLLGLNLLRRGIW
jgi:uncharacterized membrane protein YfcA